MDNPLLYILLPLSKPIYSTGTGTLNAGLLPPSVNGHCARAGEKPQEGRREDEGQGQRGGLSLKALHGQPGNDTR